MPPHGFFTLGHALARVWQPAYPLLPWALTSAMLTTAGMWDYWSRDGRIEWVVMGLAAYELMLGLLEDAGCTAGPRPDQSHQSRAAIETVET